MIESPAKQLAADLTIKLLDINKQESRSQNDNIQRRERANDLALDGEGTEPPQRQQDIDLMLMSPTSFDVSSSQNIESVKEFEQN